MTFKDYMRQARMAADPGKLKRQVRMTTDPGKLKRELKSQFRVEYFRILSIHCSKKEAQSAKEMYAMLPGRKAYPGDDGPEKALWYVCEFEEPP